MHCTQCAPRLQSAVEVWMTSRCCMAYTAARWTPQNKQHTPLMPQARSAAFGLLKPRQRTPQEQQFDLHSREQCHRPDQQCQKPGQHFGDFGHNFLTVSQA
eukprot:scaffold173464_cov19-Tisochrysis_lutea.AAC.1